MTGRILVDTGPLVAVLSRQDAHHEACVEALREMASPLLSCWPVITEAAWLLRRSSQAVQRLLATIDTGSPKPLPLASGMERYQGIRPQLPDAALVYLAGRERIETIFTLDPRDFSVYRTARKRAFRIVPETR